MNARKALREARLILIGIPDALWTLVPIYHMFLFALSSKDDAFSGELWPSHPTLNNFRIVFEEKHYFLNHFWRQLGNSLFIAIAVGVITLVIIQFQLENDAEVAAQEVRDRISTISHWPTGPHLPIVPQLAPTPAPFLRLSVRPARPAERRVGNRGRTRWSP